MKMISAFGRAAKLAVASLALAGLAACASSFNANVSHFSSQLPAPAGQTFTVVPEDPALANGLEFHQYAQHVADHLAALGYKPVDNPANATLLVHFDYGVDRGRAEVVDEHGRVPIRERDRERQADVATSADDDDVMRKRLRRVSWFGHASSLSLRCRARLRGMGDV